MARDQAAREPAAAYSTFGGPAMTRRQISVLHGRIRPALLVVLAAGPIIAALVPAPGTRAITASTGARAHAAPAP